MSQSSRRSVRNSDLSSIREDLAVVKEGNSNILEGVVAKDSNSKNRKKLAKITTRYSEYQGMPPKLKSRKSSKSLQLNIILIRIKMIQKVQKRNSRRLQPLMKHYRILKKETSITNMVKKECSKRKVAVILEEWTWMICLTNSLEEEVAVSMEIHLATITDMVEVREGSNMRISSRTLM